MALINCPDCNKQVSSNAPTCPGCGAPIANAAESKGSGVQSLTTTQETSKRLKLHSIGSVIMLIAGAIGLVVMMQSVEAGGEMSAVPGTLLSIGIVWYIVTRFRIWWHHK